MVPLIVMLATWTRLLAVDVVAHLYGVHWNTVYAAVKAAVAYGLALREKGTVLHIGIDRHSRGFRTADSFSTVLLHCMGGLQLPQIVHRFL